MATFYAKVIEGRSFARRKIEHDLGIEIESHGARYSLSEDNYGRLILRSLDRSLVIKPESSNSVIIEVEEK